MRSRASTLEQGHTILVDAATRLRGLFPPSRFVGLASSPSVPAVTSLALDSFSPNESIGEGWPGFGPPILVPATALDAPHREWTVAYGCRSIYGKGRPEMRRSWFWGVWARGLVAHHVLLAMGYGCRAIGAEQGATGGDLRL
jgi:hypothetical protein